MNLLHLHLVFPLFCNLQNTELHLYLKNVRGPILGTRAFKFVFTRTKSRVPCSKIWFACPNLRVNLLLNNRLYVRSIANESRSREHCAFKGLTFINKQPRTQALTFARGKSESNGLGTRLDPHHHQQHKPAYSIQHIS